MAKQTFTTGQVLTAAQMTSLQQTAMLGGAASAKTASYTLVAADAGTAITMSNAGATTITVDTALFAAGDTVQITNLGAGVCTITAGTATVDTSASLALEQYESGTLYFTSASASIFIKGAGAPAASGGMTLISTTTLSGSTTTLTSIPGTYKDLRIIVRNMDSNNDPAYLGIRMNADANSSRHRNITSFGTTTDSSFNDTIWEVMYPVDDVSIDNFALINIYDYTNTTTFKMGNILSVGNNQTTVTNINVKTSLGIYNQLSAITSLEFRAVIGSFTAGTVLLYGVK